MPQEMKTLEYYRRLPYTMYCEPQGNSDGSLCWVAEYLELRGCKTDGIGEAEAIASLQELFDDYISTLLEEGVEIPEPQHLSSTIEEVWLEISSNQIISRSHSIQPEPTKNTEMNQVYHEITADAA